MKATYKKHILNFKRPSGTSRGVMQVKETWFIEIKNGSKYGIGECGILRGLSIDDRPDYEGKLKWVCDNISQNPETLLTELTAFPSIQFGLETALLSLKSDDPFCLYPSAFTEGTAAIPINGLVWMGEKWFMKEQITQKIAEGFSCIKLKIGAIDFSSEMDLLQYIRKEFSDKDIEIRVDANGAFSPDDALEKLKILSGFDIHSIEQPIKAGQWQEMASLCEKTPLPIALDEELIGIFDTAEKQKMLQTIKPQYIILKPSLIGGFRGSDTWIELAEKQNCGWWMTSALESNIGLNAIGQYTFTKNNRMPQGLGTGGLYTNNVDSPLTVKKGALKYDRGQEWGLEGIGINKPNQVINK